MNINSFLISLIPILSSVICMVVLLLPFPSWKRRETKELRAILFAFCILIAFNWTTLIFAFLFADRNHQLFWATLAYILLPIVQYHFVFKLTQENKRDRFPWIFYLIPLVLFGSYYLITNLEWIFGLEFPDIYSERTIASDKEYYSSFMQWIIYIRFLLVILCVGLAFLRYRKYLRNVVHYSSELRFSTPIWILTVLALIVFSAVTTLIPMVGIRVPQALFYTFLIVLSIVLQQIFLSFNLIRGNYVYMEDVEDDWKDLSLPGEQDISFIQLKKIRFEKYMDAEKPYLNPELKITDMIKPLQTNRTYLSSFINTEYGMNFSRLINFYRLKEYDHLLTLYPEDKDPEHQLIIRAGFGSYQSYLRARKLLERE